MEQLRLHLLWALTAIPGTGTAEIIDSEIRVRFAGVRFAIKVERM